MSKLIAIKKRIAALEAEAARLTEQEMAAAIVKVKEIMSAFGLTVEHLRDAVAGPSRRAARKARPDRAARGVAKYADPKTGDTWSGLGRAPRWIASARNRDAFLIDKGGKAAEAPAAKKRQTPKASSIKKVAAAKKAARKKAPRAGAAKSTASSGA